MAGNYYDGLGASRSGESAPTWSDKPTKPDHSILWAVIVAIIGVLVAVTYLGYILGH